MDESTSGKELGSPFNRDERVSVLSVKKDLSRKALGSTSSDDKEALVTLSLFVTELGVFSACFGSAGAGCKPDSVLPSLSSVSVESTLESVNERMRKIGMIIKQIHGRVVVIFSSDFASKRKQIFALLFCSLSLFLSVSAILARHILLKSLSSMCLLSHV